MSNAQPYTNDGSYLDAEFHWLSIRAKRLATERVQRERALDQGPQDDHSVGDQELVECIGTINPPYSYLGS